MAHPGSEFNVPPEQTKAPTITKSGKMWTYVDAQRILVSSNESDKKYMLRLLADWKTRNDI